MTWSLSISLINRLDVQKAAIVHKRMQDYFLFSINTKLNLVHFVKVISFCASLKNVSATVVCKIKAVSEAI